MRSGISVAACNPRLPLAVALLVAAVVFGPLSPAAAVSSLPAASGPSPAPTSPALPPCSVTVPRGERLVDGNGNYAGIRPGDTVCLQAGTRGRLRLFNLMGTAAQPIIVRNAGGVVNIVAPGEYAGIEIRSSARLHISGSGVTRQCGARYPEAEQRCGIRVSGSEDGLTGRVKTEYLTVDHVEIGNVGDSAMGVHDKSVSRGGWIQRDIAFRDIYLHDVHDEGHYHGSSDYLDGTAGLLDGVEITRNLIVRTGRDGIQVGSTPWNCTISGNVVRDAGLNGESSHRFGIVINRGAACDIEGNRIYDSAGDGIYDQGLHGQRIVNNLVVRSGRLTEGAGINVREGNQSASNPETPDYPRSTKVWHNTIVTTSGHGIRLRNAAQGAANHVTNNVITGAPTGAFDFGSGATATRLGNVVSPLDPGFVDPTADDYRLRPSSPAARAGVPVPVTSDLLASPRPQTAPSSGAYEVVAAQPPSPEATVASSCVAAREGEPTPAEPQPCP